jgi:aminoglycoside 6-adenylyltransferase
MDHDHVLNLIIAWATADDNVRAVVLTGSAARGDAHELSDLDIEVYAAEPSTLLDDDSWYVWFGDVLVVEALANPGWHPTRLIYYVGGKIDFMVAPIETLAVSKYNREFRVLVDKDSLTGDLPGPMGHGKALPDSTEFLQGVHWFYAAALMCAKCVVRDEPWLAKVRDWDMKRQLLRMIEWEHMARYGALYDTWYNGKHLNTWMDEDVRTALDACWAGFAVAETAQALLASVELYARLSSRAAGAFGLDHFDGSRVRGEITAILAKAAGSRARRD